MIEGKNKLIGIWIIAAVLVLLELYYWFPVYTGTYESMDSLFALSGWGIWVRLQIFLAVVLVFSVTYGFYKQRKWARYYTIVYLGYSGFWAIVSMFIWHWQVIEHYMYFVIYVIAIMYLLASRTRRYFGVETKDDFPSYAECNVYRYGDYTLYKREAELKKGGTRTFYYFCKEPSDKGSPCSKPDEYNVGINKKNGMPYLKKKK